MSALSSKTEASAFPRHFCFTPPSRDRLWRLPHPFAPQQLASALSKLLSNDSKLLAH